MITISMETNEQEILVIIQSADPSSHHATLSDCTGPLRTPGAGP